MITANKYEAMLKDIKQYTNEDYLTLQVWQLKNVFFDDLVAIKNTSLEYIAFSTPFALEFSFNENLLGHQLKDISKFTPKLCKEVEQQENNIIAHKVAQDAIFQANINKINTCYVMRRRPLINPWTQYVVGIIIFCIKFDVLRQRRIFAKTFAGKTLPNIIINESEFTESQQQIITCLLLGFHQRKEIAALLNSVTQGDVNDILVKNTLQALYNKYNCNSTYQLIHTIIADEDATCNISDVLIPDGSYPIEK